MAYRVALGIVAMGALFAMQTANAQTVNGCPAGQAMQSSDPSGRNITCVPIPNVSGLQSQISTETANRQSADTQLQSNISTEAANRMSMDGVLLQQIQQETSDRKAADDALRNDAIESSIVGTYTFTGPVTCLNSSNGFNADFTPKAPAPGSASTVVQLLSGMSTGTRTFIPDGADTTRGTGTFQVTTFSVLSSSVFFSTNIQNFSSAGVAFAPPPNPSGGASAVDQGGSFTWEITPERKLIITEDNITGTFTAGNRAGWSVVNSAVPRQVGVLGKDLRTIALTVEALKVENTTQTSPDKSQSTSTDRICARERLLRKL